MNDSRRALLIAAMILVAAVVFIVDLLTPVGLEVWVLYLPVILAPVWFNDARAVVLAGVSCSALLGIGTFIPQAGSTLTGPNPQWWDWTNRGMGLFAMWFTAFAGIIICKRSNRLSEVMRRLRQEVAQHEQTELARKELEHEVQEIAALEQRRIGQELHDSVGQMLAGLGLMANALDQRLSVSTPEKQIARRLVEELNRVHQQVRTLSHGLVPVEVEAGGLSAALEDLAANTSEQSGVRVTFDRRESVQVQDHTTATELFRIAQEAVTNALRHGRPQHITLTLVPARGALRLGIEDDGAGMQDAPETRNGMGIRIMRYRAALIGGVLEINCKPGGGTLVTCTLPKRPSDDDGA